MASNDTKKTNDTPTTLSGLLQRSTLYTTAVNVGAVNVSVGKQWSTAIEWFRQQRDNFFRTPIFNNEVQLNGFHIGDQVVLPQQLGMADLVVFDLLDESVASRDWVTARPRVVQLWEKGDLTIGLFLLDKVDHLDQNHKLGKIVAKKLKMTFAIEEAEFEAYVKHTPLTYLPRNEAFINRAIRTESCAQWCDMFSKVLQQGNVRKIVANLFFAKFLQVVLKEDNKPLSTRWGDCGSVFLPVEYFYEDCSDDEVNDLLQFVEQVLAAHIEMKKKMNNNNNDNTNNNDNSNNSINAKGKDKPTGRRRKQVIIRDSTEEEDDDDQHSRVKDDPFQPPQHLLPQQSDQDNTMQDDNNGKPDDIFAGLLNRDQADGDVENDDIVPQRSRNKKLSQKKVVNANDMGNNSIRTTNRNMESNVRAAQPDAFELLDDNLMHDAIHRSSANTKPSSHPADVNHSANFNNTTSSVAHNYQPSSTGFKRQRVDDTTLASLNIPAAQYHALCDSGISSELAVQLLFQHARAEGQTKITTVNQDKEESKALSIALMTREFTKAINENKFMYGDINQMWESTEIMKAKNYSRDLVLKHLLTDDFVIQNDLQDLVQGAIGSGVELINLPAVLAAPRHCDEELSNVDGLEPLLTSTNLTLAQTNDFASQQLLLVPTPFDYTRWFWLLYNLFVPPAIGFAPAHALAEVDTKNHLRAFACKWVKGLNSLGYLFMQIAFETIGDSKAYTYKLWELLWVFLLQLEALRKQGEKYDSALFQVVSCSTVDNDTFCTKTFDAEWDSLCKKLRTRNAPAHLGDYLRFYGNNLKLFGMLSPNLLMPSAAFFTRAQHLEPKDQRIEFKGVDSSALQHSTRASKQVSLFSSAKPSEQRICVGGYNALCGVYQPAAGLNIPEWKWHKLGGTPQEKFVLEQFNVRSANNNNSIGRPQEVVDLLSAFQNLKLPDLLRQKQLKDEKKVKRSERVELDMYDDDKKAKVRHLKHSKNKKAHNNSNTASHNSKQNNNDRPQRQQADDKKEKEQDDKSNPYLQLPRDQAQQDANKQQQASNTSSPSNSSSKSDYQHPSRRGNGGNDGNSNNNRKFNSKKQNNNNNNNSARNNNKSKNKNANNSSTSPSGDSPN